MSLSIEPKYKIKINKNLIKDQFYFGLAEKPTAAKRISKALDSKSTKFKIGVTRQLNGKETKLPDTDGYIMTHSDKKVLILAAFGHLFTLIQDGIGWQFPVYSFKWVPLHQTVKNLDNSKFHLRIESAIEAMRFLSEKCVNAVIMTDYDEEGEVIGGITISKIKDEEMLKDAKRMKFSTFAKEELQKSFKEAFQAKHHGIDFGMYNRGLMRHYLDWLWGINISRSLMLSLKNTSGRYHTLSTGRVQGPTLSFVSKREFERNTFVPLPYFDLEVKIKKNNDEIVLNYEKGDIINKSTAFSLRDLIRGKDAEVTDISKRKSKTNPPVPYNLSSLQKDAYQYYRINPSRTLQIAEKLYLGAGISYPRTSSEKYPPDMDHRGIVQKLGRQNIFKQISDEILIQNKLIANQGKKTDPAHPCIYPTGIKPANLNGQDLNVYNMIVHRYFAGFGKPAIIESSKVNFDIVGHNFNITGSRTVDLAWKKWAGVLGQIRDRELPIFKKGEVTAVNSANVQNKFSKPPAALNQASLLRLMEANEIGTKATRSEIINNLFDRKYLSGEQIKITSVGEIVNDVLSLYSPQVVSVELSRQLEKMGDLIESTIEKDFTLEDAITQGVLSLHQMLVKLKENESEIGRLIDRQLVHLRREEINIGKCIQCETGDLKIIRSISTGKRFVGCSNYFDGKSCDVTFPLPQSGKLDPLDAKCKSDGYPQIRVYGRKKPWILCLHPSCLIREEFRTKMDRKNQKNAISPLNSKEATDITKNTAISTIISEISTKKSSNEKSTKKKTDATQKTKPNKKTVTRSSANKRKKTSKDLKLDELRNAIKKAKKKKQSR